MASAVKQNTAPDFSHSTTRRSFMIHNLLLAFLFVAALCGVSGDAIGGGSTNDRKELVSGVTTDTTSAAFTIPAGIKTIYGQVVGTGAVTQTQALYGDIDNDAANGVLLCTITLSGTTRTQDACPPMSANFPWYYITTTNTTGTSATGALYAGY